MNTSSTIGSAPKAKVGQHLVDAIREFQGIVGDGLNDDEFTRLLQNKVLPDEAGFGFLSYSDSYVTLSVPAQDLANWYPQKGWIAPEKERIAREIADKYGLLLCEPPDAPHACFDLPNPHHHLELTDRRETIIVAHPQYLKVRLFEALRYARAEQRPLTFSPDLLRDLSRLYQA